ncbi:MAG: hypothetical protein WAV82_06070, partial [Methylobacter sp.]
TNTTPVSRTKLKDLPNQNRELHTGSGKVCITECGTICLMNSAVKNILCFHCPLIISPSINGEKITFFMIFTVSVKSPDSCLFFNLIILMLRAFFGILRIIAWLRTTP